MGARRHPGAARHPGSPSEPTDGPALPDRAREVSTRQGRPARALVRVGGLGTVGASRRTHRRGRATRGARRRRGGPPAVTGGPMCRAPATPRGRHPRTGPTRWRSSRRRTAGRIPELVPLRWKRMLASPFGFLRGAAVVMAHDLAATPVTGVMVQVCGDAHAANFGVFATPERRLVFDVTDFDETLPRPVGVGREAARDERGGRRSGRGDRGVGVPGGRGGRDPRLPEGDGRVRRHDRARGLVRARRRAHDAGAAPRPLAGAARAAVHARSPSDVGDRAARPHRAHRDGHVAHRRPPAGR